MDLLTLIALAIPATLIVTAVTAPRRAVLATGAALVLAILCTLTAVLTPGASIPTGARLGLRFDAVTFVMLLLVSGLGVIIVRYSRTCLQGDPGIQRYLRWLLSTLSAVTALILTNDLLVLAIAWAATSLALHQLLTFYAERPPALVAAHKKFLVSRLADLCLATSLTLVHHDVGSFDLDRIAAWAQAHPQLTPSMQIAALLVVIAVALRSAQLPFHGWLIQVMEAPTPVSALLHAGVVNIGGFVLIRLAPWLVHARVAQLLLIVIGLSSAVVAALVMTTRVSVKVALAWSTCAQMGFMLVQCGLGLWQLALLHIVAHSLYKAHAFLSAGSAVEEFRLRALAKPSSALSWTRLSAALLAALGCALLGVATLRHPRVGLVQADDFSAVGLALLVSLSLIPLVVRGTAGNIAATAGRVSGVVLLYFAWHAVAAELMPVPHAAASELGWALVGAGVLGLFAVKAALQLRPQGALSRALYPWLFSGLYLDERFTRLTFRVWPPRFDKVSHASRAIHASEPMEAQV